MYLCSIALVFAFVFFVRMQEDQTSYEKLRSQGVVSHALVTEKSHDPIERRSSASGPAAHSL